MLIIFYLLLMFRVARCTGDLIFETRTVGDDVKLTCARKGTGSLFWIRLVPGNFPEVLGKTFSFEGVDRRITTKEEPGTFVLHIPKAKTSDTAVYVCMKIHQQNFTFLKGTDLRVEGPEPDITEVPPSDPVHPGDSVTLQCSVLYDSENKTCPEEHSVCCLRGRSHQSHPSFNYTQGNSSEEYEKKSEGLSAKKCVYSFFKNISSSDGGNYYCAVSTCGEILFRNRSNPDTEVNKTDVQKDNKVLFLLCAALAISLIVIAVLIYTIKKLKKDSCGFYNASVALQTNATTASGDQQSQQTDEDSLVYSAAIFTGRKSGRSERRDTKTDKEESIYTEVRALVLDEQSTH